MIGGKAISGIFKKKKTIKSFSDAPIILGYIIWFCFYCNINKLIADTHASKKYNKRFVRSWGNFVSLKLTQ